MNAVQYSTMNAWQRHGNRVITFLTAAGFLRESIGSLRDFVHCTHPGMPQHGTFATFKSAMPK
jgi:hypothetical protein